MKIIRAGRYAIYRLRFRGERADRSAIRGERPGKAHGAGVADRAEADRGRRAPDHILHSPGYPLTARGEGADLDGEQHFQQLANGGCGSRGTRSAIRYDRRIIDRCGAWDLVRARRRTERSLRADIPKP